MKALRSCFETILKLILLGVVIAVSVAVCLNVTGEPNPSAPRATPRTTPTAHIQPTPRPQLTKRPWHERCFSAWDGSHAGVNELIKADLISPDSFEHVETLYSVKPDADGTHRLKVTFSSVNLYNARLRGLGYGSVNPATCRAVAGGVLG